MNKIPLKDMTDEKVVDMIEKNIYELCKVMSTYPNTDFRDELEMFWFATGVTSPVYNAVCNINITSFDVRAKVEEIISHFTPKKVPVLWWIGPGTRPENLPQILEDMGFKRGGELPGMAVDIRSIDEKFTRIDGLNILPVEGEDMLNEWVQAAGKGFGVPEMYRGILLDMEAGIGFGPAWRRYTGVIDGETVGASALLLGSEAAGIYNVAVAPEYRGKGIGSALTVKPLLDALKIGYETGILQSSPMGVNVYKSIGFREYCTLKHYVWLVKTE